ncbi:hypothetical protein CSV76_14200 [Sporosarcina sp. P17b]|nr:hypothetical protein CSV76_14200 [Sporosarcina sp. P17b]
MTFTTFNDQAKLEQRSHLFVSDYVETEKRESPSHWFSSSINHNLTWFPLSSAGTTAGSAVAMRQLAKLHR